jgi:hypothetical protein
VSESFDPICGQEVALRPSGQPTRALTQELLDGLVGESVASVQAFDAEPDARIGRHQQRQQTRDRDYGVPHKLVDLLDVIHHHGIPAGLASAPAADVGCGLNGLLQAVDAVQG